MAFNRERTIALAEKFVRSGKIIEAVGEYKKLADDNPRDMNVINKLGDLLARAGKNQEAQRYFLRIAEFYAKDGFYLKAIAMYKKITKTDPSNLDCLQRLAGLYQQQGLASEAKAQYLQVADQMVRLHQYQPAAEVLPKVLEIEPDNLKVRLTLAELLARTGRHADAGREFSQASQTLLDQDMPEEALKVIRKGLKHSPGQAEIASTLLSIVRAGDRPSNELVATAEEIAAADGDKPLAMALLGEVYRRRGDERRAGQILGRLQKACGSPEDAIPEVAEVVAGTMLAAGRADEAYEWTARAADGFARASRPQAAAAVLDAYLAVRPDHPAALESRAEIAAARGDPEAEAAALERLAPILIGAARPDRAREVLQRLVELRPGERRFVKMLEGLEGKVETGAPAPAAVTAAPAEFEMAGAVETEEPGEPEAIIEEIAAADGEAYGPVSRIQEIQLDDGTGEPIDEEFVSEHVTEAEVFIKYGLLEKAKLQLHEILKRYPRHVPAHVKLKEIFTSEGNTKKAVEACLTLVDIKRAEGDSEEARALLNEAIRLDPQNPGIARIAGALGAAAEEEGDVREAGGPGMALEADEGVSIVEESASDEAVTDLEIEIELPEEAADTPAPPAPRPAAVSRRERASARPQRVEEETPDDLPAAAAGADDTGGIDIDLDGLDPGADAPEERRAAPTAAPVREPDSEKLGEVDFYVDQGLLEEARQVIYQLRKQYPQSAEVAKRLQRIEGEQETPVAAAPEKEPETGVDLEVEMALSGRPRDSQAPAKPRKAGAPKPRTKPVFKVETHDPSSDGDFVDLAAELDKSLAEAQAEIDAKEQDALEGPGHTLDDIFRAFKKGVEQQVDSEDYDTHYNLGIAYREMGLVDEAIGEFQFAARDPARVVECCGILGLCFRDKGMPDQALQWYRKGLDMPGLGERESIGLRYDIAEVYREKGELKDALELYKEVYGADSTYRDVRSKIDEVKGRLG